MNDINLIIKEKSLLFTYIKEITDKPDEDIDKFVQKFRDEYKEGQKLSLPNLGKKK